MLISEEEVATGSIGLSVYWRYFKSIGFWLSFIGFASNFLHQVAAVYSNGIKNSIVFNRYDKSLISVWLTRWSLDPLAYAELFWRNFYAGIYGALGIAQGKLEVQRPEVFILSLKFSSNYVDRLCNGFRNRLLEGRQNLPQ